MRPGIINGGKTVNLDSKIAAPCGYLCLDRGLDVCPIDLKKTHSSRPSHEIEMCEARGEPGALILCMWLANTIRGCKIKMGIPPAGRVARVCIYRSPVGSRDQAVKHSQIVPNDLLRPQGRPRPPAVAAASRLRRGNSNSAVVLPFDHTSSTVLRSRRRVEHKCTRRKHCGVALAI